MAGAPAEALPWSPGGCPCPGGKAFPGGGKGGPPGGPPAPGGGKPGIPDSMGERAVTFRNDELLPGGGKPGIPGGGGPIPGGKGGAPGGNIPGGGTPGGNGGRAGKNSKCPEQQPLESGVSPNGPGGKGPCGANGGGGARCCGPNPNPPGGGPPPDSYAAVIWSMMFCALSWPRATSDTQSCEIERQE